VLPRIKPDDSTFGNTYKERTKNIAVYFKSEYAAFKNEQETASLLWPRIFYNYIFKGPVLEWYTKIKWNFESKNYEYYNSLIENKNAILDLGCGYGYLTLYLHYKNENRKIVGIDYDEEKIEIAKNNYDKKDNLQYCLADVRIVDFGNRDVIFCNDILHYLEKDDQLNVLEKCYKALNDKGILIIRDGITDFGKRHAATKITELFSTKIFKFNKKKNDLYFFASDFIREFAKKNNLTIEIREQSRKTSNTLFVLRKN
jgi:2-polyprenyl-3-methyl-5-hydroxy-6-metoxy-1,4-benzoquinol methylase